MDNLQIKKSENTELFFEKYCRKNEISCIRLECDTEAQSKFLKDPKGKCPDYLCTKTEDGVFVEVKTHTLWTNKARSIKTRQTVLSNKAIGLSGTTFFDPFDPRPELKVPFEGYLRNASKKFKNVKDKYNFPRVLLVGRSSSSLAEDHDFIAVFRGEYPSFKMDGSYAGLQKEHTGLFDSTGRNVSALVYWSISRERYEGMLNPHARIVLSHKDFEKFFKIQDI